MTRTDELLSALVDGECSPAELDRLLRDCAASPELLNRYQRMCAVRELVRGGDIHVDARFCQRVMSGVTPEVSRPILGWRPRRRSGLRPVVGWALAASFGALATLAVTRVGSLPTWPGAPIVAGGSAGSGQQVAKLSPISQVSTASAVAAAPKVAEVRWDELRPEAARQLDDYLLEHASYRSFDNMGGAVGYARVAAHQISYRSDNGSP